MAGIIDRSENGGRTVGLDSSVRLPRLPLGCVDHDHWRKAHGDHLYERSRASLAFCPFPIPSPSRRTPTALMLAHGRWFSGGRSRSLACFGRIDRSTFEICFWLDATLCVCHLRLVNG